MAWPARLLTAFLSVTLLCPASAVANPVPETGGLAEWKVLSRIDRSLLEGFAYNQAFIPDSTGAMGRNKAGWLAVGIQRNAYDQIPYGVLEKRVDLVMSALRSIQFSFSHERADGSFGFMQSNGTFTQPSGATPFAVTQTEGMYLNDAAHTLILLQQSPWIQSAPENVNARAVIAELKPKVVLALRFLIAHAGLLQRDTAASNRTVLYGASFYFAGILTADPEARALGRTFLESLLRDEAGQGVFPENGGFDSHYQSLTLQVMHFWYLQLAAADLDLKNPLASAILRASKREAESVMQVGEVDVNGNTRVNNSASNENSFGVAKSVNGNLVALSLGYCGAMFDDPQCSLASSRVWAFYRNRIPNDPRVHS